MLKKIFHKMNSNSVNLRKKIILNMLDDDSEAKILDLGCDEGSWSIKLKEKINSKQIYGIDIIDQRLKEAKEKGVITKKSDLNENIPFENNFFDVIHADQVIEHIANLDRFISEIHRVLKPGGYIIISTENGSSWHNIFASILGWQIFSLTNLSSKKSGIGNPLAIHRGKTIDLSSWTHKTIFNYRGLKEFFEAYSFKNTKIVGSGYHPLPAFFGKIDPRHSHYITLKCYK
ncbi:MAG: class I SAM-dependent methyltransferase [Patescibacteria group bacterium]